MALDHLQEVRRQRVAQRGEQTPPIGMVSLFLYKTQLVDDLVCVRYSRTQHKDDEGDPKEFESPQKAVPYFSYTLLVVSAVILIYTILARNNTNSGGFASLRDNPLMGPSTETLLNTGAVSTIRIVQDNEWWRLFVANWLHAGILHYAITALFVWFVGRKLEREQGAVFPSVVVFVGGTCAYVISATFSPFTISLGPSGGLCAWLGACASDGWLHLNLIQFVEPCFPVTKVRAWMALELFFLALLGYLPWIDNFAHMGGFLLGAALGVVFLPSHNRWWAFLGQPTRYAATIFNKLFVGLVTLIFILSIILFLYNSDGIGDLPCRRCHNFLNCPGTNKRCSPCRYVRVWKSVDIELDCPYGDMIRFHDTGSTDWFGICEEQCEI